MISDRHGQPVSGPVITDLVAHDLPEVGEVMALAFREDPAMRYFIPGEVDERLEKISAFGQAMGASRLARGQILKGIREDGKLAAVIGAAQPVGGEENDLSEAIWRTCFERIGYDVGNRVEAYGEAQHRLLPSGSYHYVIALGTHPDYQGKGYGRALLEEICALAAKDPNSQGVCLDTESKSNVSWYESLGFSVVGQANVESLSVHMLRRTC